MPIAELKDSGWTKIEIECLGDIQISSSPYITFVSQLRKLHVQSPITKVTFNNDIFKIEFQDNRIWKIRLYTRNVNTEVSYMLMSDARWIRSFIFEYLTPLTNIVISMYSNYGLVSFICIPI